MCLLIRVTGSEYDVPDDQTSGNTVVPSLIKQPRIVFTGVSGAMMTKMKEVGWW